MKKQFRYKIKIKISKLLGVFTFLMGSVNLLLAQEGSSQTNVLKLSIQLRPRAEIRNGVFTPQLINQDPASFISQRTRIGLNYQKGNKLTIGVQLQVVNIWGKDPQVQQTANDVNLYQAWAQLFLLDNLQLKIGRQVLSYDDERILGNLDWNNSGRKHDAALFKYQKGKFKSDLALAFNQNQEKLNGTFFNDSLSQPYKSMQFVWMQYNVTDALSLSALTINLDKQSRTDSLISHQQTFGGTANLNIKNFKSAGSLYGQAGRINSKTKPAQKTMAWMASLSGVCSLSDKLSIGLGTDYLSGKDMEDNSSTISNFNPLYGTHHKFYGYMDYFYVSSPHKNVGLWDNYLNSIYRPLASTSFQLVVHHFSAAGKVLNYKKVETKASLGNEIDLTFQHQLQSSINLTGGYSQIFNNNSMKYVKNIPENQKMKSTQNWVWLSINIQPEILIH